MNKYAVLTVVYGLLAAGQAAAFGGAGGEGGNGWDFSGGFLVSPEYRSILDDAYPESSVTGGFAWFDLGAAYRWRMSEMLSIHAGANVLVNAVTGDDSYVNFVLVPGVSGRYRFSPAPCFYAGAEANLNMPTSGSSRFDFSAGGLGLGLLGGYEFQRDWRLELGYLYLPVKVSGAVRGTKNVGGLSIRFAMPF